MRQEIEEIAEKEIEVAENAPGEGTFLRKQSKGKAFIRNVSQRLQMMSSRLGFMDAY